ncbi:MAG: MotA/TolQ/ExbB proton channel family protein [Elusimicrobiota bacterium]
MGEMTFRQMLHISIAMPLLLVLSVLVLAQVLERIYVFWVSHRLPEDLWRKVNARLDAGDLAGALGLCRHCRGHMAEALEEMLCIQGPTIEKLVETFQLYRQRMQMDLSRRLGFFGTASFISPLIGLMGTVLGIMRAFHDLSVAGAGGPTVVAAGISEALITTAAGIGVAVASAIFYNYFTLTARHQMSTADLWVFELAKRLSTRRGA